MELCPWKLLTSFPSHWFKIKIVHTRSLLLFFSFLSLQLRWQYHWQTAGMTPAEPNDCLEWESITVPCAMVVLNMIWNYHNLQRNKCKGRRRREGDCPVYIFMTTVSVSTITRETANFLFPTCLELHNCNSYIYGNFPDWTLWQLQESLTMTNSTFVNITFFSPAPTDV